MQACGMGDNSIFIVFSTIWSPLHLKIPPQFQAFWQHKLFTLDMGSLKKILLLFLLPFYSCAPCLNAASKSVLLLYAFAHKISLK
jgi:hypothetical protein